MISLLTPSNSQVRINSNLKKLLKETEEGMLPNSHDEANMTLKSKPNEDVTIKLEINTLINIHVKILNKKKYQTESINIYQE